MSMDDAARHSPDLSENFRLESAYRRGAHQAIEMLRMELEEMGAGDPTRFIRDLSTRLNTLRRTYTRNRSGDVTGFKERGPIMHLALDYARRRHAKRPGGSK